MSCIAHILFLQCASVTTVLEIPKIEVFNDESSVNVQNGSKLTAGSSLGNLTSSADRLFLSDSDLKKNKRSHTISETDDEESIRFYGLNKGETMANSSSTGPTVIVDPPSPPHQSEIEEDNTSAEQDGRAVNENFRKMNRSCRRRE